MNGEFFPSDLNIGPFHDLVLTLLSSTVSRNRTWANCLSKRKPNDLGQGIQWSRAGQRDNSKCIDGNQHTIDLKYADYGIHYSTGTGWANLLRRIRMERPKRANGPSRWALALTTIEKKHADREEAQHFFDYELRPQIGEAGTYFYHSHVGFQAVSAAGPLIVLEADGEHPYHYDEERILFFSELYNNTDDTIQDGLTFPYAQFLW